MIAHALGSSTAPQLIQLANAKDPGLQKAILSSFTPEQLKAGTAWSSRGSEFFFVVESKSAPTLVIDGTPRPAMEAINGTDLWYSAAEIQPLDKLHAYNYVINNQPFGGSRDVPAWGPLAYLQPGVPSGTLSERLIHTSRIYDGMKSSYWIYVPSQYRSGTPAALMVFQDGHNYIDRDGPVPALNVIDNLIASHQIPVLICVFIDPGDISGAVGTPTYESAKRYSDKWSHPLGASMRSILYDTVSDRYPMFLQDELLAEIEKKYSIRSDAYSRAISGASSGGICAFNTAWQRPQQFSRVISWIGSFVSLQWREDPYVADGGQDYPDKVLREEKRNIRVWLQDGSHDMEGSWFETHFGSWPAANVRMANALKTRGYDYHLSFGSGTHNNAQGAVEFPAEMIWLWRDYDPAKTNQNYEMDPLERNIPLIRISSDSVNRDLDKAK